MSEQRNNKGCFVGAHVPEDTASKLALACAALDTSKSSLLREALAEYLSKQRNPSLISRMAGRLRGEWQLLQASATGMAKPTFASFRRAVHSRLVEDGVSETDADRVIDLLKKQG